MSIAWNIFQGSLAGFFYRLLPVVEGSEEAHDHSHILLVSIGLITAVFSLLYVTVSCLIGFRIGMLLMTGCFVMLLVILALFKRTGWYRISANLYLACCFFVAIFGCSFYTGGIHSMVMPWFTLVPLASVLLLELKVDTIIWVVLACSMVIFYGIAGRLGFHFPMSYETEYTDLFNMICIVGLVLILSLLAFIFGRNRVKALFIIRNQKISLEEAIAKIEQLAFYDTLTKLPNRRLFTDRLNQALAESRRSERYGALLFLDLDDFKPVNDIHGHEAGDMLLVEAAARLTGCMRETDTVARFGGDEFAIILNSLDNGLENSKARASIVAQKISEVLAEPYILSLHKSQGASAFINYRCTASIGVVFFLDHDDTQDQLLNRADEAMYHAKSTGKNVVHFYKAEREAKEAGPWKKAAEFRAIPP